MKMSELDLLLGEFEQAACHIQELAKEIRAFITTKEEQAEEENPISFTPGAGQRNPSIHHNQGRTSRRRKPHQLH